MEYIKNLDKDEIRSNFLVKSDQKRLWNAQISLIVEFQRICEKYGLRFFADGGTLLGAVRHRGFIPWDCDIDLCMFRDDYEKFKAVAPEEIHYPYYLDIWYENIEIEEDPQEVFPHLPFMKLRDERTTAIENDLPTYQCIGIDIFPMDSYPPFDNDKLEKKFRMLYELTFAACWTKIFNRFLQNSNGQSYMLDRVFLKKFSEMPMRERGLVLEKEFAEFDHSSKNIFLAYLFQMSNMPVFERSWFDEPIYMPFENISLPVSKEFDKILTGYYGRDWNKPKFYGAYSQNYSVDIPFKIYQSEKNYRLGQNFDELRDGKFVRIGRRKFWNVQLDLIEQLKRLGIKFFAIDQTLFEAVNFRGLHPDEDIIQVGMTRDEFKKMQSLEIEFPYRLLGGKFSNDLTSMVDKPKDKNIPQGIFIEIITVDYDPEIVYMPFENISIPVPKNYPELLKDFEPSFKRFIGDISPDIPWQEYIGNVTRIIYYATQEYTNLEK